MYSIYLFYQQLRWPMRVYVGQKSSSMNSVFGLVNRVHWTRFVSLETKFVGLGFKAYKPSPKNSVYMPRNWVHWTRFHLSPPVHNQTHSKILKTKTLSVSKYIVSQSHSLSLSVSLSLSSQSQSLLLSLSCSVSVSVAVAVAVALNLSFPLALSPSLRLRLAQSFSLSGWLRLPHKK